MTGGTGTNPIMVLSVGYNSPQTTSATNPALVANSGFVQCGSSEIPCTAATTYKVSFAVIRNHFDVFAGQEEHQEK